MKKIKVLIVDDSALIRNLLTEILKSDTEIEVVGTAADPYIARDKIKKLSPDVLTLDIEMPRMDGIQFLENLMRLRPMPVVMVSTLTEKGADVTFKALELGAVDFVTKPTVDVSNQLSLYSDELIEKVKAAAVARIQPAQRAPVSQKSPSNTVQNNSVSISTKVVDRMIAIGASTGGTEAIKEVLMRLPADTPPVVITQHIPEAFSAPFAHRMNTMSEMEVCEAKEGQKILHGHVYIAPGDRHLLVVPEGDGYVCQLSDEPRVNRHRPAVDVMFRSVAQNVNAHTVGVILTGMGTDGAIGMKELHEAGAFTVAQDEETSVVWGMPGASVKLGGVDKVLPLNHVATEVLKRINAPCLAD
ncbi:MAG: chemotaxis response regulator protein-glutamate methylesterase [Gammaproteobacteria bacterium]|nr:chemotaxis response regulator protein-glutamate methylesterase [Gammaproteobacteria bacterium]